MLVGFKFHFLIVVTNQIKLEINLIAPTKFSTLATNDRQRDHQQSARGIPESQRVQL